MRSALFQLRFTTAVVQSLAQCVRSTGCVCALCLHPALGAPVALACLLSLHRVLQLDLSNQDMMERVIGTNGSLEDELTGSDVALFKSQRSPKSTADLNDAPFD